MTQHATPNAQHPIAYPCRVAVLRRPTPDIVSVWLNAPEIARAVRPGQFVQVRIGDCLEPYLRRPISVTQRSAGRIRLVFRVVGRGTALLASCRSGDTWDVIGPLGRPLRLPQDRRVVITGGGIGIAPLLFLAEEITAVNDVALLLGAKHRQDLILRTEFRRLGVRIQFTTEDGSLGTKGLVTDLLGRALTTAFNFQSSTSPSPLVFACGPRPMLRRVKELCAGVEVYAFWEERMGCGTGICYGCAVKSANSDRYIRFCQDGPVLNLKDIEP